MKAIFDSPKHTGVAHIAMGSGLIFGVSLLVAHFNFLLARILLEGLAIAVALLVYVFASQTRKYTRDDYLLLLGYGCLTVALLDFFHLLNYRNVNVFSGSTTNASVQFWVAARYVQAFSLLIAPFAAKTRFRAKIVLPAYLFAAVAAILSIMVFDTFPTCYIEGQGLTPVKIIGELIVCAILVAAICFTWNATREIGAEVALLVILSMFMIIASELFATLYTDVDSIPSLLAHACKGVAMYLIFHGTVAEGLNRPFMQVERARKQLLERLRFEELVTELSTELAKETTVADIKSTLRSGLLQLAEALGADVATLIAGEGETVTLTLSARVGGGGDADEVEPGVRWPWLLGALRESKPALRLKTPEGLPPEAVAEKEFFRHWGVRVFWVVPCAIGEREMVAIGLGACRETIAWDDNSISRLRLAGELFANALARGRSHEVATRLRNELNHVSRVSTMGQLTAALAHEIKQPLTAILSNAQVGARHLLDEPLDIDELRDIFSDIVNDDRRASAVIDRIREWVKKGESHRSPARLSVLAEELIAMLRHVFADQRIDLERDYASDEPAVCIDRTQIQQVMLNVLINAVDAMESVETGKRAIRLACRRLEGEGGERVEFSVADTGVGIPQAMLSRVFTPFETSKAKGLGMGLAISRGIVEDHAGSIRIVASSSVGTTVAFELPIKCETSRS